MARRKDELTDKEAAFVWEYLIDFNATQAAIRAGYSKKTAGVIGHQNLKKPKVIEALAKERKKLQEATDITPERVLREFARIGFADQRKLFTDDWGILPPSELDDDTAAAIVGVKVSRRNTGERDEHDRPIYENVQEYKLADKKGALDSIAKHLGMFVDKTEDVTPIERKVATTEETARALAHVLQQGLKGLNAKS